LALCGTASSWLGVLISVALFATLVIGIAVVAHSLIDIESTGGGGVAGTTAAILVVGGKLLLALRASGLARRWQRVADVVVVIAVAINVILLVLQIVADLDATGVGSGGRPFTLVVLSALNPIVVVRLLLKHHLDAAGHAALWSARADDVVHVQLQCRRHVRVRRLCSGDH
jgi:hypothetical protein